MKTRPDSVPPTAIGTPVSSAAPVPTATTTPQVRPSTLSVPVLPRAYCRRAVVSGRQTVTRRRPRARGCVRRRTATVDTSPAAGLADHGVGTVTFVDREPVDLDLRRGGRRGRGAPGAGVSGVSSCAGTHRWRRRNRRAWRSCSGSRRSPPRVPTARHREPLRLRGGQDEPEPGQDFPPGASTSAGMVTALHSAWTGASGPGQYIASP